MSRGHWGRGPFIRARLPEPLGYYAREGLKLTGTGTWRSAVCPFHGDTRPSLRINAVSGAWRCMACSARGGDVLDFHRQRHGLAFMDAAKALGAWRRI